MRKWNSTLSGIVPLVVMCCPANADVKDNAAPKIKPGEQYRLSIQGIPVEEKMRFDGLYKVDSKGGITIPYVGRIQVEGMTIEEAETAMEDALMKREVYKLPDIKLEEFKKAAPP